MNTWIYNSKLRKLSKRARRPFVQGCLDDPKAVHQSRVASAVTGRNGCQVLDGLE